MYAAWSIAALSLAGVDLGDLGSFDRWGSVEVQMAGPASQGMGMPNPFAVVVDVTFTGPGGQTYVVPAYYDGDGAGGLDGNVWRARFSADENGMWTFTSASGNGMLDGCTGEFSVVDPPATAPEFYRWGRLEAVAQAGDMIRYLKFRDGPFWLKAGCDDPENFLGGFANYDTTAERMAGIDYLAARGINSMYIMTHNVNGDDNDVWPWVGATSGEAMANGGGDARFDVAKLAQWRELFEYMTEQGVVPYLILEDDSSWTGYDHARYYREIVARFGDLPAVTFNLGEEANENYGAVGNQIATLQDLADVDPYAHPRGIHNINDPNDEYLMSDIVDFTAIQTGPAGGGDKHNQIAIDWTAAADAAGVRRLVVNFDEGRPEEDRSAFWAAFIGGGVWEAHVLQPYDQPFSAWDPLWDELGGARAFMETVPFERMEPRNDLVTAGTAFCLAATAEAYVLYLPEGGDVTVDLATGEDYEVGWWDPTNDMGGSLQDTSMIGGGAQSFTAPGPGDWALRIAIEGIGGGSTGTDSGGVDSTGDGATDGGTGGVSMSGGPTGGPGTADGTATGGQDGGAGGGDGGGCGCRQRGRNWAGWAVLLLAFQRSRSRSRSRSR